VCGDARKDTETALVTHMHKWSFRKGVLYSRSQRGEKRGYLSGAQPQYFHLHSREWEEV
jgi:hypothetical protein